MLTASQARKESALYLIKQDPVYACISLIIDKAIKKGEFSVLCDKDVLKDGLYGDYAYNLRNLGYEISEQHAGSDYYIISWGKK